MPFAVEKRATLLIPSGPSQHLFVVVTNPCGDGQVLMVSISSVKPEQFHDPTCEIAGGAHPAIPKDSFVSYRHALAMPEVKIQKFVDSWYYHPKEPIADNSLFGRICAGIDESDFTPLRMVKYYAANGDR
jgi:hypothetical protein